MKYNEQHAVTMLNALQNTETLKEHDRQVRVTVIYEFAERLKAEYKPCEETDTEIYKRVCDRIDKIAEQITC